MQTITLSDSEIANGERVSELLNAVGWNEKMGATKWVLKGLGLCLVERDGNSEMWLVERDGNLTIAITNQ